MDKVWDRKATVEKIAIGLMSGDSLRKICKADDMPNKATVFKWLDEDEELATIITRARDWQTEHFMDEIIDIAKACGATSDEVAKAKLEIHTMQWVAGRQKPKKYGNGVTLRGDADNPLNTNISLDLGTPKYLGQDEPTDA